ncbi:MAG TPA: lipocalin-like domain-containing protein [Alphaproteobacteria bacterium]|nr:lipocalin-like domain-containing protein [Alphaproteobacteria bacterium]
MDPSNRLVGQWRLLHYQERRAEGEVLDVFGKGARGRLAYFADGRMMVVIAGDGRPRLRGPWPAVPREDKAAAYDRLIAYAGRYTDRGDRVIHHVEICWIPNWEGRDVERLVIPDGDGRMILRTPPGKPGDEHSVQDLLWERAD